MPAAQRKQQKPKEHVKGLETDENLDKLLTQFAEKRSQQILNDTSVFVKPEAPKAALGTKAERRAKRKELQAKSGLQAQAQDSREDNQDLCMNCAEFSCRLSHWLPGNFQQGAYDCQLCNQGGVANAGVWHCPKCSFAAHVSCYSRRKEAMELTLQQAPQPLQEADCPKPSLAWDPLSLTGPHMAIGAGAGVRSIGEVALD